MENLIYLFVRLVCTKYPVTNLPLLRLIAQRVALGVYKLYTNNHIRVIMLALQRNGNLNKKLEECLVGFLGQISGTDPRKIAGKNMQCNCCRA